jgi:HAD superfamily hydrolase (TIGR01509 family)
VAVETVVFDVGETLVDETRMWEAAADAADVPRFTLMGVLGGLAARGENHNRVWEILGVDHPESTWEPDDFYADALPCLARLREHGYGLAACGNTPASVETALRRHFDRVGSSAGWGVDKPAAGFFAHVVDLAGVEAGKIAYVGDRVDNDVIPALAAGMVAVHIQRGPWGLLHDPPPEAIRIRSLDELPEALP